jgi:2-phosphosulfolactate phosphatase
VMAIEDFVCGGHMVARLQSALGTAVTVNDGAYAARVLSGSMPDPEQVVRSSSHGRRLAELGFEQDLRFCARIDKYATVPVVLDGRISGHDSSSR